MQAFFVKTVLTVVMNFQHHIENRNELFGNVHPNEAELLAQK
jgi:hypothetical protein